MTNEIEPWSKIIHDTPSFQMYTKDQFGFACEMKLQWHLSEEDASCWKRPLSILITPVMPVHNEEKMKLAEEQYWEVLLDLTRSEMQLLRDALDLFLKRPDLRQESDGMEVTVE
jgi:hypothetical protein